MKKHNFFSFGVYKMTLHRLLLPFIVFTVLSGIVLLFPLFSTYGNDQGPTCLLEVIEKLYKWLGFITPCTVLFSFLAFPQIRKRRDADYFDSLPERQVRHLHGMRLWSDQLCHSGHPPALFLLSCRNGDPI